MSEDYSKFKNLLAEKVPFTGRFVMREILKDGLIGNTRSLIDEHKADEEIISVLQSLTLNFINKWEIKQFVTDEGFDYQGFLNYCLINQRFTIKDCKILENLIFVREIKQDPEKVLDRLYGELGFIINRINNEGIEVIDDTNYYLISFLSNFVARKMAFRVDNKDLLTKIATRLDTINTKIMESKKKISVEYKGVPIQAYGDSEEALEEGLKNLMLAIEKLPEPLKEQLKSIKGIQITDLSYAGNLKTLMTKDKHLNDPFIKMFCAAGVYFTNEDKIIICNVGNRNIKSMLLTLAHELGHGLDKAIGRLNVFFSNSSDMWRDAKKEDGNSVSSYGDKYIHEDFAETCKAYQIAYSKKQLGSFYKKYPARGKLLDVLFDLRLYDPKHPESMAQERKNEILRLFEASQKTPNPAPNVLRHLLGEERIEEIYNMSPDKKIEVVGEAITNGYPEQFQEVFLDNKFLTGFNKEELRRLFDLFGSCGYEYQSEMLQIISYLANEAGLVDVEEIKDSLYDLAPKYAADAPFVMDVVQTMAYYPDYFSFSEILGKYRNEITPDMFEQLVRIFFDGYNRRK